MRSGRLLGARNVSADIVLNNHDFFLGLGNCKTYPIRLHGEPMISFACRGAQAHFSLWRNPRQVRAHVVPSLLSTNCFPTEALVNAFTRFEDTPPLVINVGVHFVIANCECTNRLCGGAVASFRELVGARDACRWARQCDFLCTKVARIYTNIPPPTPPPLQEASNPETQNIKKKHKNKTSRMMWLPSLHPKRRTHW
jgi:hypothetical protein